MPANFHISAGMFQHEFKRATINELMTADYNNNHAICTPGTQTEYRVFSSSPTDTLLLVIYIGLRVCLLFHFQVQTLTLDFSPL